MFFGANETHFQLLWDETNSPKQPTENNIITKPVTVSLDPFATQTHKQQTEG